MSGFENSSPEGNPCPKDFVPINDGSMSSEVFLQWLHIRKIECGPRLFFDAQTGQQLTDQELLVRVFNGSTIPEIPLPSTLILLLSAIFILRRLR
jgi:hypothetical protein